MADKSQGTPSRISRRGFLALASLGVGAAALLASPLRGVIFGGKRSQALASEFPGEDSIFHPREDPREAARKRKAGGV